MRTTHVTIQEGKPINYLFTSLMYDVAPQDEYATNIRRTRSLTWFEHIKLIINLWCFATICLCWLRGRTEAHFHQNARK